MDDYDDRTRQLLSTVRHAREVLTQHAERLDRLGLPDAKLIRTVVRALAKAGDRFLTDTQPLGDLPDAAIQRKIDEKKGLVR